MKQQLFHVTKATLSSLLCALMSLPTWAFESGSTGADGVLAPTEDTTLTVPVSGLLQYESVNIPTGVTVRFIDDTTVPGNPPLNILVQGDAVINGTIDLRGANGDLPFTTALPPGGFAGGVLQSTQGGPGQGPGGSAGGDDGGNGGTYAARGASGRNNGSYLGPIYGSESLQPLIGGSGGGSVARRPNVPLNVFLQGGSGGGAMLLAVSGTLSHNGSILATGGLGAPLSSTANVTDATGGGSGGAIRLVASTLTGSGSLDVSGGPGGIGTVNRGGAGGHGRTRLEADRFEFVGSVIPAQISSFDITLPQPIFPANLPTVRISTVAGSAVPANPTGVNDVALPSSISNPVTIEFSTTQVPLGSTIALTVTPARGDRITATSEALSGTAENATASVEVSLPSGASTLSASVNFAVSGSTAALYAPFADGEQVAHVTLHSTLGGGPSGMTLTTQSGRVIDVPAYANL